MSYYLKLRNVFRQFRANTFAQALVFWVLFLCVFSPLPVAFASQSNANFAYVDKGVFYLPNGEEVKHFGVNYNLPFAYGYRAVSRLGIEHKQAINMDIAHIARLGLNAYRVHVWEKEIADENGNLLKNEHLALLDYIIAECKKHNIRVILTPLAWWGNGYPEQDEKTGAFSELFSKTDMNEKRAAIEATHRYVRQFVNHINQYNGLSYKADPNILAFELFNEPRHKTSAQKSKDYINGLVRVLRNEKVPQPLFYNISEQGANLEFASAVCSSDIDGIAYQWYPTGLVNNAVFSANTLLNVSTYTNPFARITECQNKAKMIYEFDAADTNQKTMYAAMARSFREAGFQWATQFAYDPAVFAHTNTEYQTHFLNLLYTPQKAIGLMLAAEVFSKRGRREAAGGYPENNQFNDVILDPVSNVSVLNSAQNFYYTGSTSIAPKNSAELTAVAGTGSSSLVRYKGSGAYFFDKADEHAWFLELYPDVLKVRDPYQPNPNVQEVSRLFVNEREIKVILPGLESDFHIVRLDQAQAVSQAKKNNISVEPGRYLLINDINKLEHVIAGQSFPYFLPDIPKAEIAIAHTPQRNRNLGDEITFTAHVEGITASSKVTLLIKYKEDTVFTEFDMRQNAAGHYEFSLPNTKEWSRIGHLIYAISVYDGKNRVTFPSAINTSSPLWTLHIRPAKTPISIFDYDLDQNNLIYPQAGRSAWSTVPGESGLSTAVRFNTDPLLEKHPNPIARTTISANNSMEFRDLREYTRLVVAIRAVEKPTLIGIDLLDLHGFAYGREFIVQPKWQNIVIPINKLVPTDSIMAKAYPAFMPQFFANSSKRESFDMDKLNYLQGLQFRFPSFKLNQQQSSNWQAVDIADVYLAAE